MVESQRSLFYSDTLIVVCQNKENYVQDLLAAKTTTAAQSDRLLAHYRSQVAQYEAEV